MAKVDYREAHKAIVEFAFERLGFQLGECRDTKNASEYKSVPVPNNEDIEEAIFCGCEAGLSIVVNFAANSADVSDEKSIRRLIAVARNAIQKEILAIKRERIQGN